MSDPVKLERAERHVSRFSSDAKIAGYLGGGTDGEVWKTTIPTAIKVFGYNTGYENEKYCYQRLADWGLTDTIDGFQVPRMLTFDDELKTIEMELMLTPPYIIDFAKVRFSDPEFADETQQYHERECEELFEHNWPAVQSLLATLASYQIYYLDPKPGNIMFRDMK